MKANHALLGISALAVMWSGSAAAQTGTPSTAAPEVQSQAQRDPNARDDQSTSTSAADAGTSRDIIVTAGRRNENLATTAVSASVLSGADLANKGVGNVDALQFATPSIVVNNFGQGNDFNVRGIGKAEHNSQTTTGVITYRDGVPSFPGYFQGEPYYDVANIQVLRGPQGTIVGQNATGGAVFVNTNDPIVGGGVHGYINANYGNYNDAGVQGGVNLPLSDTFAARIAFDGERRDGFYNITGPAGARYTDNNNLRMGAGRLSLLWKPVEGLSILSKTDFDFLRFGAYPASPATNFFRTIPGAATPNPNYHDLFDISANAPMSARDKFIRSILKIEYATPSGLRFRAVGSYAGGNTFYATDLDGTNSPAGTTNSYFFDDVSERQKTVEFNIISPDNTRFTYLVGVFGDWNKYFFTRPYQFVIDLAYPFNLAAAQYKLQGSNPTSSVAVFGQVGFAVTSNFKIEAGGRYTWSQSTNHVDVIQYGTPILAEQSVRFRNFSYKVSAGWKISGDQYLYAFTATGFRPGGLNVPVGLGLPAPFTQEEVTSYEAGLKSNFAGGHIRTTLDGFYNSYRNFQVTIGYPTFPTFGIELNVPNATKVYGGEAEADFSFGKFSFDFGVNLLHSDLGQFFASDPRAATVVACDPFRGPASATCLNLKGREQTYAPNFTFNVGVQYEIALGGTDTLTPRVNFGHIAPQWATLFENPARGDRLIDRNILNAQLAFQHGTFTVTGYATNLTDQHYPGALNSGLYFAGPPRQYGIKVLKTF